MKFLNKHFFAGVLVGMILSFMALVVSSYVITTMWVQSHGGPSKALLGTLPELPEAGPIVPLRAGEDWTLHGLDGTPQSLAAQRGSVVFLNRWATWCKPCMAEMPSIQALYDSLHAEGVVFVLVSDEKPGEVRAFVRGRNFHAPVYVCEGKPPAAYRSVGIPATYILDRSGNVVAEHVGSANWDVARCRRYLRRLLER